MSLILTWMHWKAFLILTPNYLLKKEDAICQKQDNFKGLMWFAFTNNFANWHILKTDHFQNAIGQETLTGLDQPKKKEKSNKKLKSGKLTT